MEIRFLINVNVSKIDRKVLSLIYPASNSSSSISSSCCCCN